MGTLQVEDLQIGTGPAAQAGQRVEVHYVGWLAGADTKFESSIDRGKPLRFRLGGGEVIKGWDQGIVGMRLGGRRRIVVPPELGYGRRGAGAKIPPNATLIFEVELVSVESSAQGEVPPR
jgi:FKBP-type peptidyl-prolyl cis-trans isomerase FkpA